jgi:hypothetical protein
LHDGGSEVRFIACICYQVPPRVLLGAFAKKKKPSSKRTAFPLQ